MPLILHVLLIVIAIFALPNLGIARRWGVVAWIAFAGSASCVPATCYAGGGPENVFLLVNSTSQDSLAVANYYIALRKIPARNVFYLAYKGNTVAVLGAGFRDRILLPALAEIKRRNLTSQIDYLVYSCDFPYQVDFRRDFPNKKFPRHLSPRGSLTGLTFLHSFVEEKRQEVVSLNANWYFMEPTRGMAISRAFRSQYRWSAGGRRAGANGLSYMISAMLGVTSDRGNKVPEITNSLRLAHEADGTKPPGTVYFMKHGGPRSTPRNDLFAAAATELRRVGVAAKVLEGKFPENKMRIVGLTCGTAFADVNTSGCRFVPGAFCDNLTSYGGFFESRKIVIDPKTGKRRKQQVNIAEFIRHGATAACGTVFEPMAIRQKFPLPSVHVHYANGCSLGEAFYQSVSGPYQQLLVGDPLCQPWADIPVVKAAELAEGQLLRGQVEIKPSVDDEQQEISEFELYVDGMRIQRCKPTEKFLLDTTKFKDGHHELRIVARDNTPLETQGRLIVDLTIKNGRDAIGLTTKQNSLSLASKTIAIDVASTTETNVEVFCNSLKLGSLPTGTGTLQIETERLGSGPIYLYAESEGLKSKPLPLGNAR